MGAVDYVAVVFAFGFGVFTILWGTTRLWERQRSFMSKIVRRPVPSKLDAAFRINYVVIGVFFIVLGFLVLFLLIYRDFIR